MKGSPKQKKKEIEKEIKKIIQILRDHFNKKNPLRLIRTAKVSKPKSKIIKALSTFKSQKIQYYFVIGSSQFLLKNEPLEEMLRERAQFLKREKKPINFWLIKSPKFLYSNQLSNIKLKLLKAGLWGVELTAIVSVNQTFITWLKLRLQNVGEGSFITSEDIPSPLASEV